MQRKLALVLGVTPTPLQHYRSHGKALFQHDKILKQLKIFYINLKSRIKSCKDKDLTYISSF